MGGAETGRDIPISLEGAGLGTRCPTVTSEGCCAWANLLCSPPARWFVQSEPGFVRPARRRVPARHKFSAWARFKAGNLIPASAALMQPLTCWLQRNCSPLCNAATHSLVLPGHLVSRQAGKTPDAERAAPGRQEEKVGVAGGQTWHWCTHLKAEDIWAEFEIRNK